MRVVKADGVQVYEDDGMILQHVYTAQREFQTKTGTGSTYCQSLEELPDIMNMIAVAVTLADWDLDTNQQIAIDSPNHEPRFTSSFGRLFDMFLVRLLHSSPPFVSI